MTEIVLTASSDETRHYESVRNRRPEPKGGILFALIRVIRIFPLVADRQRLTQWHCLTAELCSTSLSVSGEGTMMNERNHHSAFITPSYWSINPGFGPAGRPARRGCSSPSIGRGISGRRYISSARTYPFPRTRRPPPWKADAA